MPDTPPVKGKGKQILGLDPVLFWGGLAVLGLGVAYFIYRRNAAQGQQAGADSQMLPVAVVGGATGLTTGQLFTWLHDHQGPPKMKKPRPVDRPKPKPKRRRRGDH
jgi:hypothetical protein